jgi:xylulokinase
MPAELLMGIDIGTYSSKGVLTTPRGEILATRTLEHAMSIPRPGWAEHDPEAIWWGEFCSLCSDLLNGSERQGSDVGAVAVSGIGPCVVPVDDRGRALRPAILYGIDTRATEEIDFLNDRYGEEALYEAGGSVLSSQAVGPKLLWLRRNEPEIFSLATSFHSANDFIVLRLTGEHVMDAYTASLYNPLFSFESGTWTSEYATDIVDIDRLPPVRWSTQVAGHVTAAAADETGLAPGTPVTVGTVDAVAEAVSVGAVRPGDLMCMYGTTTFFILATEHLASHPTMWSVSHAFPGLYGVAAGMSTTGALTRWFRNNFARDLLASGPDAAYSQLVNEAESAPRGSNGLLVLPYFSGERTPINDPDARGVICGLSLSHDRGHIFRAILEGTSYGIAHNLQTMRESGASAGRIVAVGGGTRNKLWLQIVSDVSGVSQQVPDQTIGAAYGDAFLAGYATGIIPSLDALDAEWVRIRRTIEPDAAANEEYAHHLRLFHELRMHTESDQHAAAASQSRSAASLDVRSRA